MHISHAEETSSKYHPIDNFTEPTREEEGQGTSGKDTESESKHVEHSRRESKKMKEARVEKFGGWPVCSK